MDAQSLFESGAANRSAQVDRMLNNSESDEGDDDSNNYNSNRFVYKASIFYILFSIISTFNFFVVVYLINLKNKSK